MVFVYGNGFGYKVDRENLMGVDIGKGFFVKFFLKMICYVYINVY